jgi:superfamily II RNA helicase
LIVSVTLHDLIPKGGKPTSDELLGKFLEYTEARSLSLYPAQEEAILELFEDHNVILNTPTGSGKSLVASAMHFASISNGRRSVYTCPIKALVNEKWLALCREFGPDNVGLSTGDATVNQGAPILCCTAEVLANIALRDGPKARVHDVVMDEFHFYSDKERGVAWQAPLLTLPQTRFLLMSATLGETQFFADELTRITGRTSTIVSSKDRPVPLEFEYSEHPLAGTVERLAAAGKAPVYVVHFTQLDAAQSAQDFTSINVATKEEKAAIAEALYDFKFTSPYGPEIKKWLKHGIGLHHAGLLPKYRILVEQLAQRGLLKIICGTDTLGVGVNVPIRTVLFTRLCKYSGEKVAILSARDFHQISGRAGRKGFDDVGWVVAQAPEHVIENRKLDEKSKSSGKKVVKRQAPDKNFVAWDQKTFERLITALPERLVSRFQVTHGMLLNVLSRDGDGCAAMRDLIRRSHDSERQKKGHRDRAWQLFRSLVDRKIVEIVAVAPAPSPVASATGAPARSVLPPETGTARGGAGATKLRVNVELQDDFSMDQALSLYLLDTIPLLDPEAPDYALDLITLVESIMENPEAILRRQLDKVKGEKIGELKAQGMEYDQRMEELEKLEYPKPRREFIYETFNAFADKHPWVGQENIRPKSIVREMFEQFRSFADYIKIYELHRSEGLLLRHISRAHKILVQNVPDAAKNDTVREMETYLETMIRQIDSSLEDEWERMRNPSFQPAAAKPEVRPPGAEEADKDITRDPKAFTVLLRTKIFSLLRALSNEDYEAASGFIEWRADEVPADPAAPALASAPRLKVAMEAYMADHGRFRLDPEARNARHTYVIPSDDNKTWRAQQVLVDSEGHNDWLAEFAVDLAESRMAGEPVLKLNRIGPVA